LLNDIDWFSLLAVRMGFYNAIKERSKRKSIPQNAGTAFAMEAAAGTITVYATQPFDTVKSRTQILSGRGMGDALTSVIRAAGGLGLWKGRSMRLSRPLLGGGIVFSLYEQASGLLSGQVLDFSARRM
jgi:solute carrier family 25 citrate transporter 1